MRPLCHYCEKEPHDLSSSWICPECANAESELRVEREEKRQTKEQLAQSLKESRYALLASQKIVIDILLCGKIETPYSGMVNRLCQRAETILEILEDIDEMEKE